MDLTSALPALIATLILILKFSIGVNTAIMPFHSLEQKWGRFLFSLLVLILLAPVVAVLAIILFNPSQGALLTIVLLAASPGAPLSAIKVYKARGDHLYAVTLQVVVVLISVFTIPWVLYLFHLWLDVGISAHWLAIAQRIFMIVVLPLLGGMLIRSIFPELSSRYGKRLAKIVNLLLMLAGLLLLYIFRHYLLEASFSDILLFAFFVVVTLLLGHLLGGKHPEEKTTIALMSASRHLGIAIFIALCFYSLDKIIAFAVPYIVVNAAFGLLYVNWRKRLATEDAL